MTLPLALRPGDTLLGTDSNALNDSYFNVWIFGWQARQLIADPLNLFQGNIFYPFPNTLAFSEIILPGALMYLPLEYASGNPILAYNLVILVVFALNGFTMYLWTDDELARWARNEERRTTDQQSQRYLAAFVAGVIFAFCTFKIGEIRHVQLQLALFMPLTLMSLGRLLRAPTMSNAFFTALWFALNALASLYYAVFLAFAMVLYAVVDWALRRYRLTRFHIFYAFVAALLALLVIGPFLVPFLQLERQYHFSDSRDPRLFAARPASYLASVPTQWLYGTLTRSFYVAAKGQPLFPGIAVISLAFIGLVAMMRQRHRAWIYLTLLALMGFVLSFGPDLVLDRSSTPALAIHLPYYYLSLILSPLKSLNAPARFAVLVMLALSPLAAYGALTVMRRIPRWSGALAVLIPLLIVTEYIPVPLRLADVEAGANISPVYRFLAAQSRVQPVVEVPMGAPTFADQDKNVVYTYNAIYHWQPLVNGYSTFIPPDYYALVKDMQAFPSPQTVERLKKWGVQWIVVHSERYSNAPETRRKLDNIKRLEHVQDFGDIWLYRIRNKD